MGDFLLWPDLLVLVIVGVSAFSAMRRGFVSVLLSLLGFAVALVVAFLLYQPVAGFLEQQLHWTPVWAGPLAFIGLWLAIELVFVVIERTLMKEYGWQMQESPLNRLLAVLPGALQGLMLSAVLLTLLALLPMQGNLRKDVLRSQVGSRLVSATLALERPFEGVFGPAAREALGFITVRPPGEPGATPGTGTGSEEASHESIQLQFTVDDAQPDPENEQGMLDLVNQERTSRGLVALEMDDSLKQVARAHADDMFRRGYFAHNTPEGVDPFQRMNAAGIVFGLAGENLALAPSLQIAHEGLMNSPGHRANILNEGFRKVGIGVLDGGVYGKMFVQEFTD
jgi:uncharacterized protein YkwD/uncharacterized membrane protein required for colicin V production